ncbi:hypothetical protein PR202_ga05414 [Eleusine coracana subsp. coracana]|uniref:DUF1618 domain-containing protein n=1 Tax=Eleusine coracana subsp. coracana TaxID=191504 RepID=A0AAV5BQY4_ELECO|nr:hypothetical protein PR202_ga04961 [Eleusine coracana subsp. coracana]GJM89245.1 hypothetical protein PR202_ga05414 [Eleusine coracana subsp. coracana]
MSEARDSVNPALREPKAPSLASPVHFPVHCSSLQSLQRNRFHLASPVHFSHSAKMLLLLRRRVRVRRPPSRPLLRGLGLAPPFLGFDSHPPHLRDGAGASRRRTLHRQARLRRARGQRRRPPPPHALHDPLQASPPREPGPPRSTALEVVGVGGRPPVPHRFVCNPVTGDLFRLPDFDDQDKKLGDHHLGIIIRWTLKHQVPFTALLTHAGFTPAPLLGAIDPLNSGHVYLSIDREFTLAVDMAKKDVIGASALGEVRPAKNSSSFFLPCVLDDGLASYRIPGEFQILQQRRYGKQDFGRGSGSLWRKLEEMKCTSSGEVYDLGSLAELIICLILGAFARDLLKQSITLVSRDHGARGTKRAAPARILLFQPILAARHRHPSKMPFQRLATAVATRRSAAVSIRLLRRGLSSSSASRPLWVMIHHTKVIRSPARLASIQQAEPPCASHLIIPVHLVNPQRRSEPDSEILGVLRGMVRATSGDGLVLVEFKDGFDDTEPPDVTRVLCNPFSGELFRLPDIDGTKKTLPCEGFGFITQPQLPHRPPDRYAVAVLSEDRDGAEQCFVMWRFISQTGEWDKLVGLPSPLPLARRLDVDHEVLAFDGRLWWVDVSWGAVSADPFGDRPDLRFVELPKGRVTRSVAQLRVLGRYRRMGVSEGRLRYVEVSEEDGFLVSSFALDHDGSGWKLEHQVALGGLWDDDGGHPRKEDMRIGAIDPLNATIVYLTIGNVVVAIDLENEKVLRCSWLGEGTHPQSHLSGFLKPCVLPPWLDSSRIPYAGEHRLSYAGLTCDVMTVKP